VKVQVQVFVSGHMALLSDTPLFLYITCYSNKQCHIYYFNYSCSSNSMTVVVVIIW